MESGTDCFEEMRYLPMKMSFGSMWANLGLQSLRLIRTQAPVVDKVKWHIHDLLLYPIATATTATDRLCLRLHLS